MTELFSGQKRSATPFELQALWHCRAGVWWPTFGLGPWPWTWFRSRPRARAARSRGTRPETCCSLGECMDLAGERVERPVS